MEVLKKILNIIIDIFIILVVIVSAAVAAITLSQRANGVPMIFGYVPLSVQTDSMSPTLEVGDLIIGKKADPNAEYQKGDIVTYWAVIEDKETNTKSQYINTHRIIGETVNKANGEKLYVTKGDHNDLKDKYYTSKSSVISVWQKDGADDGIRVSKMGNVLTFLRKPSGFFLCVVLPMAVFFIYELVRFITNLIAYNKSKSREAALEAAKEIMGNDGSSDSSGLSEEQKAQAILDYIEKQKQENSEDSAVSEKE